jgi:hypothetical protein
MGASRAGQGHSLALFGRAAQSFGRDALNLMVLRVFRLASTA